VRFFARIVAQLSASTPPAERRLLRSAYELHRMVDRFAADPSDSDVWELVAAVGAMKVTAVDACAAGVPEGYVRQLLAMTLASAAQVAEMAARNAVGDDADCPTT
jgi:hypothetical protein